MGSCSYRVVAVAAMTRLLFALIALFVSAGISRAQTNFSRYFDENSVPIFDIEHHLDIKFNWTMGGKVQMHMNEGLNYLAEGNLDLAMSNLDDVLKVDSIFWPAHYYRGVVLNKLGKYEDARKAFHHAIRINLKQPQPYVELGRMYERRRNYKQAKPFYEKAVEVDSKFVPGHFGLATMELFTRDARRATRLYEQCIELDSSYAEAYVVLSILKFRDKKKNNESVALLNRALRANPKYKHTYFWRGYFHIVLEAPEKALADWTSYLNSNPGDPFMLSMRGFLFIEMNRFDEAFTDLRKAFLSRTLNEEAFRGAQTLLDKQIDLQAATQYILRTGYGLKEETFSLVKKGYCLLLAGRSQAGLDEIQKAENLESSATIFLIKGIAYEHINDHPSAYRSYDRALALDNDIFDAHKKRAIYRMEMKQWTAVEEDIQAMLRLMPDSKMAYRFRGFSKSHQGDYKGAIGDLTKYIQSDSLDAESFRTRAVCRLQLGDAKGANDDLRQVLNIQTDNWVLYEDVAKNYLELKDTSNAIEVFTQYSHARPGLHIPYLELARLYVAKKQWQEVINKADTFFIVTSVSQLFTTQRSEVLYLKAEAHYGKGDVSTAIETCTEAIKLLGSNLRAKYLRARCYEKIGDKKKAISDLKDLKRAGYRDADQWYSRLSGG